MKFHATVLLSILFAYALPASALEVPIPRFREVSPQIYRGARPKTAGMNALSEMGIRVDLDLENEGPAIRQETLDAARLGIRIISKPMSGFWAPHDAEVSQILSIIADPANYPLFIHCKHGEDRTGLIVGLHRVAHEGWSPAAAYAEMKADGFHPALVFLNHYFEKRTGFED